VECIIIRYEDNGLMCLDGKQGSMLISRSQAAFLFHFRNNFDRLRDCRVYKIVSKVHRGKSGTETYKSAIL